MLLEEKFGAFCSVSRLCFRKLVGLLEEAEFCSIVEARRFETSFLSVTKGSASESLRWWKEELVFFPLIFLIMFHTFFLEVFEVTDEQKFLQDWRLAVLYTNLDLALSCWWALMLAGGR